MTTRLPLIETLQGLPHEWPDDPLPWIRDTIAASGEKLAVVDDDPTGTQTIYGVAVLTDWSVETIRAELESDLPAFFIVTNSRGMTLDKAKAVNGEVGRNLRQAIDGSSRKVAIFTRGDSTLRGHYPGEDDALDHALGGGFDARILVPFFLEGGRYTINDVHYVSDGEWLTPAGDTEFARDPALGYRSSNLRQWVEEMTDGKVSSDDVVSISLEDIREGGPERVALVVSKLQGGLTSIVNAASMRDVEVVTQGLLTAEAQGSKFLYRTAASIIRARIGQTARAPLTIDDLNMPASGGALTIVGSYIPRTTAQLNELLAMPGIHGVEVNVTSLVYDAAESEVARAASEINENLSQGLDVVAYTSRELLTATDADTNLTIGQKISDGLVAIIDAIDVRPRYMISKGGMTTSNISTRALGVKRAVAMGQVMPGIPTWELGPETRFPGLALVVFPGNVGDSRGLVDMVNKLSIPHETAQSEW
ncbi:MAG: four-carbon acid sugar kinase family protein [SAR202 cluster bacterium]|jgi:uncharacterized protein YgbK (DUF1537 family)|nr:four-carbon acid sugar kinase family protein [SAR202 cluster bacterium]MDP6713936.1 four-carbon acid sugar kinase family protein [SAR202 cluster bacterium]